MDVKDYRRQVEQELSAPGRGPDPQGSAPANPVAMGFMVAGPRTRQDDRQAAEPALGPLDEEVPALLDKLKRPRLSASTRLAAFQKLAAATFLGEQFTPYRSAYLAAMRELLRDRLAPLELRAGALSVLAGEHDPAAQKLLEDGLLNPAAALVPAPAALALLSLDDHSNAAVVARRVFEDTKDSNTREAALRVVAADPNAADLLATVAADKNEDRDLRAMGAVALRALNPERFSELARNIILDDEDYEEIRAASIGAFANRPDLHIRPEDDELRGKIANLAVGAKTLDLSKAAERLIANDSAGANPGLETDLRERGEDFPGNIADPGPDSGFNSM